MQVWQPTCLLVCKAPRVGCEAAPRCPLFGATTSKATATAAGLAGRDGRAGEQQGGKGENRGRGEGEWRGAGIRVVVLRTCCSAWSRGAVSGVLSGLALLPPSLPVGQACTTPTRGTDAQ
jgi:hypothetical protein